MTLALLLAVLAAADAKPKEAPRRVYVGAYLTDVSDFDLKAGRFKADVMVWAKWMGSEKPPSISFENGEIDSKEDLGLERDGDWRSARWRIQGTFRGDFPVHAFPFDRQTLPVVFGLPQSEGELVPDLGASGMSTAFSITGWDYEPFFSARADQKGFSSDLGSIAREGQSTTLNRVTFTVELHRPAGPYLFKFALPLLLILLMALLALLLPPTHIEVRSAMAMTALLSCFAFQYSQSQSLPEVSYLVAADAFFIGGYIFVSLTLVISVISFRNREKRPHWAKTGDRLGVWGLPAATLVTAVWVASSAGAIAPKERPPAPQPPPAQPVLRFGVTALDTLNAGGLPSRRASTAVRTADGSFQPLLVEEAPAMTNALVRLLPGGGMRVRWRLKENARWNDGVPITVQDMVFSINTAVNPLRTGVDVVDPRTIDITYSERRSEWLEGFVIYPRARVEAVFADGGREAMTRAANDPSIPAAGPYVIESFDAGVQVTLARNTHALIQPVFDKLQYRVFARPQDAAEALLQGDIDVLPAVGGETWAALQGRPEVKLLEQPGDLLYVLVPNLREGPWADLRARQALLQVIDRQALVKLLEPLPAQVAASWRAGFKSNALPRHDPAEGARTLKELGLTGTQVPLHVMKMKSRGAGYVKLTEALVKDLEAAGLVVTVEEHAEMVPLFLRRDHQGLLFISRDTTDPLRYLNVPYQSGHYAVEAPQGPHFDAPMVEAWERYSSSLYEERRAALEKKLMTLWAERLPMVPLVLSSRVAAVRAELEGPEFGEADALLWNISQWRRKSPPDAGR